MFEYTRAKFRFLNAEVGLLLTALALLPAISYAAVLEEIIVTAQKREQDVSDVSIAITAFSGDALRELNMTNSVDIAGQTPGLNIGTPVGEGNNPSITLRGVGLNDFNDNNEGPIAVYRDDVYQSAMPGLTFQMFDLERVEVLRGPQGTLYGRNATGGLLHFISKTPSDEFDGYVDLTAGENSQVKLEGAVGGALSDSIQGRLSVALHQHDGYVKNRIGPDGNETDSLAWRAQLNFDVNDNLSVLLNVHSGENDVIAPKYQHQAVPGPVDFYDYADLDGDNFAGEYDRDGVLDIESKGASATVNWSGESINFVSITAFESVEKIHQEDTDMGPFAGIEPTFQADVEQFSQEFRLSGNSDKVNWVAGVYYFDSNVNNKLDLNIDFFNGFLDFLDNLSVEEGGFFLPPALGGPFNLLSGITGADFVTDPGALAPWLTYDVDYGQDTESLGIFGQVEYAFTDKVSLIAGLRYTTETRDFDYLNAYGDRDGDGAITNSDGALNSFFFLLQTDPVDPTPPEYFRFKGDIDNDNVSGKVGLDFRPNENTLVFASYSRGFKSGGFNGGFLDFSDGIIPTDTPYDEEILNSYELGIKTVLADGTFRFSATAFFYDYQDFQALTFSGFSQFIENSDATISGLDTELTWQPDEHWDILLGASFLNTEVDQVVVQGTPIKNVENVLAPEFTVNGLLRYALPIGSSQSLAFQVDFNHQAEHFFDISNSDVSREGGYTVYNARISYKVTEELSVSGWVKNFTDEEYRVYTFDFSGPAGFNQQFFAPPRWYGFSVNYQF